MELLMMKTKRLNRMLSAVLLAVSLVTLFSGCMTLTDKAGKLLEGKFDYVVNRYRSPKTIPSGSGYQVIEMSGTGGHGLDIIIEDIPAVTLKASFPEDDGSFYLKSLDYLAGNPSGWVEFSLDLSGGGNFITRGGTANLRLRPPTEPVQISQGKIRRLETHLSGADAVTALNNRSDRIQALTEWMQKRDVPPAVTRRLKNFAAYWKPLLLPELVEKERRPRFYDTGTDTRWVTAEQVKWNATYTEQILPEELRPLRDSGTLKRDWEESYEWLFLVYAWEYIFNTLETSSVSVQKK
jgi:hypothetical protein